VALVRDWASACAYAVHEVAAGVHAGLIQLAAVDEPTRESLCHTAARHYSSRRPEELAPVLDELLELPTLRDLAGYDGSYLAQAAAKRATSELTGRFAGAAIHATRAAYGDQPLARYAAQLVVPSAIAAECALLKALAAHYVMARPGAAERQAGERALLCELVEAISARAPKTLEPHLAAAWRTAPDDRARLRVVIDQVAQLTDAAARAWHARLTGGWRVDTPGGVGRTP
jgi:dGTPase